MDPATLSSCAIVFVTPDLEKTAAYYRDVLGFRLVDHYDLDEPFAALYRDAVELVLVQAQYGRVRSNRERYGAGYDAYLVPATADAGVDAFYRELEARGATIVRPPGLTPYGSYEFAIEDVDGRQIGIGRITREEVFFSKGDSPT
jgi:catechol 2,3-dioxygenase-like lactoylglutathione lyase family enzyme